jgi:hypothetical protein
MMPALKADQTNRYICWETIQKNNRLPPRNGRTVLISSAFTFEFFSIR